MTLLTPRIPAMIIAALVWLLALGPGRADILPDARALAARFTACELLHLTDAGYWGPSGRGTRPPVLTLSALAALTEEARTAGPRLVDRDARAIHLGHASSIQAARVYARLGDMLRRNGLRAGQGVGTDALAARAAQAAALVRARDDVALCVDLKWANKRPDWMLIPVPRAQMDAVRALFAPDRFHAQLPGLRALAARTGLSPRTLFEMRALRLALFQVELGQGALGRDRGDFIGNLTQQTSRATVCTDEATITAGIVQRVLIDTGLVRSLTLLDGGAFAHRRPPPRAASPVLRRALTGLNNRFGLTDHFAPILRDRGSGRLFVLDSWVEDGGLPPHIAPLDRWHDRGEADNIVPLALAADDGWIDALLDRKLMGGDGHPLRARRGSPAFDRAQALLIARHFGGRWPRVMPDPRPAEARRDGRRWVWDD